MDDHDRERLGKIAHLLTGAYALIALMLGNLDDLWLNPHKGEPEGGLREKIAEDLMMVHRDILPTIEQPGEILAVAGAILLDWVTLNDLATLCGAAGITRRRVDLMEELAGRLTGALHAASLLGLLPGGEE